MNTDLPNKPSALLRLALADLAAVEKDPRYRIDMGVWHQPETDGDGTFCYVCLAGAVLARTVGFSSDTDYCKEPILDPEFDKCLDALNLLRAGSTHAAAAMLGFDLPAAFPEPYITPYYENPAEFKNDLAALVRELEGVGV